jgi:hypothetical protein
MIAIKRATSAVVARSVRAAQIADQYRQPPAGCRPRRSASSPRAAAPRAASEPADSDRVGYRVPDLRYRGGGCQRSDRSRRQAHRARLSHHRRSNAVGDPHIGTRHRSSCAALIGSAPCVVRMSHTDRSARTQAVAGVTVYGRGRGSLQCLSAASDDASIRLGLSDRYLRVLLDALSTILTRA